MMEESQFISKLTELRGQGKSIRAIAAELGVNRGRVGRRDEAIRQYDTCRRILREEIGVRPSQETEALYEAMHA